MVPAEADALHVDSGWNTRSVPVRIAERGPQTSAAAATSGRVSRRVALSGETGWSRDRVRLTGISGRRYGSEMGSLQPSIAPYDTDPDRCGFTFSRIRHAFRNLGRGVF